MATDPGAEPERLRRGKRFEAEVVERWRAEADGQVTFQKAVSKPSGRPGRIDVHVAFEDGDTFVAVVEVKATDWDVMTTAAVPRNVRRQARQIWQYIDSQLAGGRDVSAGVVFPARPGAPERLRLVEQLFEGEGLPVVWEDESIEDRRSRADEVT